MKRTLEEHERAIFEAARRADQEPEILVFVDRGHGLASVEVRPSALARYLRAAPKPERGR
jgi:hypothetical protein